MSDVLQVIAASSLFHGLSMEECQAFVPLARPQLVAKGEYLFRLGQLAPTLFIVRSGLVELTMPLSMRGGDQDVAVEEARAGDTVAWSALIDPYRFTMSGRAGSDVELLGFSPSDLQAALAAQPDIGLRILTNLAQVIARRLQVTQTLWTRELQRAVNVTFGSA